MTTTAQQQKVLYTYEIPLGGKRTFIGGGWLPSREEVTSYKKLSAVDFEILSYRMNSIANEARQAILRVSGSAVVAEGGEALFAIYDPHGLTSSLACGLLLHTAGTQGNVREVLDVQGEAPGIYDGDIFMLNEPSVGGFHACDQWTGTPIYHEGELIAWLGSLTHTSETGAIEPGGMPASAKSLLDEGYRVQGIKVQERGQINKAAINCLLRSTRDPAYYVLDLRARIAGLNVAKERFKTLIKRYGIDKVKACIEQNIDHGEEMARAKLRSLADGTWRLSSYLELEVGDPKPRLIKISLEMTKKGDELILDFDASGPNPNYYNCYINGAFGLIYVAISSQLFWETPGNWGYIKPIKTYIPQSCCLNAPYMTPVSLCAAFPVTEQVTGCVGNMFYTNPKLWQDINAPWQRNCIAPIFWGGLTQFGYPSGSVFSEAWATGTGAGIEEGRGDGCDTGGMMMTVESSISDVEMMELQSPFLYLWRREGMDNAGAGRWRGGASVVYAITPHNSPYVMVGWTTMGAGVDPTQSMSGAYPPGLSYSGRLVRGLNLTEAWQKGQIPQTVGELEAMAKQSGGSVQIVTAPVPVQFMTTDKDVGAGGFGGAKGIGDPLDREPERVLADIENRIFSIEFSEKIFGVVVDPKTMKLDLKATEKARNAIVAERKKKGVIWGGKK